MYLKSWADKKKDIIDDSSFFGEVILFNEHENVLYDNFSMPNYKESPKQYILGSISKILFAHLALIILEKSEISLDSTLCQFFKKIPPSWSSITIKNLIYHESGIENFTSSVNFENFIKAPNINIKDVEKFIFGLKISSNKKYSYSNSNYFLLARILEISTNETLQKLFLDNISAPLGLKDTFVIDNDEILGFTYDLEGNLIRAEIVGAKNILFGSGNIASTCDDFKRYVRFLLQNEKILRTLPFKKKSISGVDYFWHGGICSGFQSLLYINPIQKFSLLVLSNCDRSIRDEISNLIFLNKDIPKMSKLKLDWLKDGAYIFEFDSQNIVTIYKNNSTLSLIHNNVKMKLFQYNNDIISFKNSFDYYFKLSIISNKIILENHIKKGETFEVYKATNIT